MTPHHQREVADVVEELGIDPDWGLSQQDVQQRRDKYGKNRLVREEGRGAWRIIRDQLIEPMVLLLMAAALVSGYLGEYIDTGVILAIVVLNAALGFFEEYSAERALAALKEIAVPTAGWWYRDPTLSGAAAHQNTAHWRTMVFMVVALSQMGNVLALRSSRDSVFAIGFWSNP